MSFATSPSGLANLNHVTPRPTQGLFNDNYLSFDSDTGGGTFAQQFLPEIYEKEVIAIPRKLKISRKSSSFFYSINLIAFSLLPLKSWRSPPSH